MHREQPPSALDGVKCTRIARLNWEFDGHPDSLDVMFEIACPCGGKLFTVGAWFDGDEARPPITIACSTCDTEHVVFDAGKHGYDAADRTIEIEPEGDVADDLVPADFPAPHQVIIRYEYSADERVDPKWRGREQELFTWFTLLARDAKTGQLAFIFEEECA
jgi:hypothetical protein